MATKVFTRECAMESIKEFNTEVRSISGCCKIVQAFWSKAEKAMGYLGLKQKNKITPQNVIGLIADNLKEVQSDGTTKCYLWVKKYDKVITKSEDGSKVVTKFKLYKGKKVFVWEKKEINVWTVNIIFAVLEQSRDNNGAMPSYPKEIETYHKAFAKASAKETATAKASAKETATAKASAKETATAKASAKETATAKASAKKTATAKASAKKTATAKASAKETATAKASAKKTATATKTA